MSNNLSEYAQAWLDAKQAEADATKRRRELEDEMASLIGVAENMEGTETAEPDGYVIKITGKINRTVDGDKLQELANEAGLFDHLQRLFKWKPSINMAAWKNADASITGPLASAITAKPGRASFKIEPKQGE